MNMSINFPHLGIYLEHVGKSISIHGFSIAYYGIIMGCSILLGLYLAEREANELDRIRTLIQIWLFMPSSYRSSVQGHTM